jgi:hypothetical protein
MTEEIPVLAGEQARLIWQDYLRRTQQGNGGGDKGPRPTGTQPPIAVILDAALGVATHALTGATSAMATRCDWSVSDEEYTEAPDSVPQVKVWNHSETDEYEINTFGKAEWIDGHWWFMGDCGPMASR